MSAAPPHSSSASFPKLAIDSSKNDFPLEELLEALICMRQVIENVVEENNLKSLYEEYRQTIDALIKYKLMKCYDFETDGDKFV